MRFLRDQVERPEDLQVVELPNGKPGLSFLHEADVRNNAFLYAELGWAIFPVRSPVEKRDGAVGCSCENPDCQNAGKHPHVKHWTKLATSSVNKIEEWFKEFENMNLGVVTGKRSGLLVLDVDPRNGGNESFWKLQRDIGELPSTCQVLSGGGGFHLYFRSNEEFSVKNLDGYPGIDIQSKGGSVIAPPSIHKSCRRYEWKSGISPHRLLLLEPPRGLLRLLRRAEKAPRVRTDTSGDSTDWVVIRTGMVPEGARNMTLVSLAGAIRNYGADETVIAPMLTVFNENCCQTPLPEAEVKGVARSCAKYNPVSRVFDVIGWVLSENVNLKPMERLVLVALIRNHADWNEWTCFPSQKTIGDEIGLREKAVRTALTSLREKGLVSWISKKTETSTWRTNHYTIHVDRILSCLSSSS